jgi:hypothetical protein
MRVKILHFSPKKDSPKNFKINFFSINNDFKLKNSNEILKSRQFQVNRDGEKFIDFNTFWFKNLKFPNNL